MSRVHITFNRSGHTEWTATYDVVSPDFSQTGIVDEVIGKLSIDAKEQCFIYEPTQQLKEEFCPPEYFEKYNGDFDKVDEVCQEQGFKYTAWSYYIHKKAKELTKSRSFEQLLNTGVN